MSAMSLGRHGRPLGSWGYCFIIASISGALEDDRLIRKGIRRERPVGLASVRLAKRSVGPSIEVRGAEVRPSQVNSHDSASDCVVSAIAPRCPEHCLRSFRVHPLDPELDLAVLPGDVADPRVEGPTLRRARLRFRRLQGPSSQPYQLNLRVSPVIHGASLPEASPEDPRLWPSVWAARSVPASAADPQLRRVMSTTP